MHNKSCRMWKIRGTISKGKLRVIDKIGGNCVGCKILDGRCSGTNGNRDLRRVGVHSVHVVSVGGAR